MTKTTTIKTTTIKTGPPKLTGRVPEAALGRCTGLTAEAFAKLRAGGAITGTHGPGGWTYDAAECATVAGGLVDREVYHYLAGVTLAEVSRLRAAGKLDALRTLHGWRFRV